jgi:hypothetical protein
MMFDTHKYLFLLTLFFCVKNTVAQTKPSPPPAEIEQQKKLGKNIYTKGAGLGGKITANMSGVNVPATVMTCINCHAANGKGNPEGGIVPSNITWLELTKSYGGQRQNGKKYPPYTEKSLKKAITMGLDPGGNELNSAMPRYNMSISDLNNLVSYLKTLGINRVTTVNNAKIEIGVALPDMPDVSSEYNDVVKKMMNAYCERVNKNGGIYNRKLQADYFFLKDIVGENRSNSHTFLKERKYLTLTGFGLQNKTAIFSGLADKTETPALLTFAQNTTSNGFNDPFTFYMYPSLTAQAKSLLYFNKKNEFSDTSTTAIIIYQNEPAYKTVADNLALYYYDIYGRLPELISINNNLDAVKNVKNLTDNSGIFYFGSAISINQLALEFDKQGKYPYLFALGNLSMSDLSQMPQKFNSKIFIAYTNWASEMTMGGVSLYQSLKNEYKLGNKYRNVQLDVMAVIITLEECFKRIGKDLTKEKLQKMLENLNDYRTGVTPAISYNLNQRVGSINVYIATFDEEKKNAILVRTIKSSEL